jgi:tRNA(Ile)-lysidine synthase
VTNFETQARRLRFQALGKACRDSRISSLLLAHHEDDQAETILVRIAGGYTGAGLQGIREQGDIPECFGIYGVHASGAVQEQPSWASSATLSRSMQVADGGVIVKRPLLDMSKSSLVEMCQESGVEWFEDPTNQVATLTPRNTVRSLWKSDRLPKALRKSSMLLLAALEQARWRAQEREGLHIFNKLPKSVNLAAGTMAITVTPAKHGLISQAVALNVLDRLAKWLSPRESFQRKQLAGISKLVFPSLASDELSETSGLNKHSLTAAGIRWQGEKVSSTPVIWRWHLSRQRPSTPFAICTWSSEGVSGDGEVAPFGTWQLFDGRYWLRVSHGKRDIVIVKTLKAKELADLRSQLNVEDRVERKLLDYKLHEHAPGDVRYSLPILLGSGGDVLGLPSLGWIRRGETNVLKYDIQYKRPS